MPIAEAQAEWVADLLGGRATLPSAAEMREEIASDERKMRKRYVASKRHTIQVDFHPYLREIRRERKRAAAARSDERRGARPAWVPARARHRWRAQAPPPCGPRAARAAVGSCAGRRLRAPALKPPSESSAARRPPAAWLAHQTSQSAPKTGIFSTTSRKKIGQKPSTRISV